MKLGFAMTGSFCTFQKAIRLMEELAEEYDILPIMSETAYGTDTRFGAAEEIRKRIEKLAGRAIIHTIADAEPIGPKGLTDVLIVAPCTGNTLAKLANGVNDTAVTMAVKSHLRNGKPVVIAVSTNDALGTSAANIGRMLARKNVFFVPMSQDDPQKKPMSMTADLKSAGKTIKTAISGAQIQPIVK